MTDPADPDLPPLLTGHPLPASADDAFAAARAGASRGTLGAGDLVWSPHPDRLSAALVLEPDVPLSRALQMIVIGEVALADALAVLCPPQVAVTHRWPGDILLNGGHAGRVRLAAPDARVDTIPAWLVLGFDLALTRIEGREPGETVAVTALAEEGGEAVGRNDVLEALAAHLLKRMDEWQERGLRPAHDLWLFRAEGRAEPTIIDIDGSRQTARVLGRDEAAGLVVRPEGEGVRTLPFLPHLATGAGDGA